MNDFPYLGYIAVREISPDQPRFFSYWNGVKSGWKNDFLDLGYIYIALREISPSQPRFSLFENEINWGQRKTFQIWGTLLYRKSHENN